MKTWLATCVLALCISAQAQEVSEDSIELAGLVVDARSEELANARSQIRAVLRLDIRLAGSSDETMAIFEEEINRSFDRHAVTRLLARVVNEKFTPEEVGQMTELLRSDAGKPFVIVTARSDIKDLLSRLVQQACANTVRKVSTEDAAAVERVCPAPTVQPADPQKPGVYHLQIAQVLVEDRWAQMEMINLMVSTLMPLALVQQGGSSDAAEILGRQFREILSKANVEITLAVQLAEKVQPKDAKPFAEVQKSPAGQKYLHLMDGVDISKQVRSARLEICQRALPRIKAEDKERAARFCAQ